MEDIVFSSGAEMISGSRLIALKNGGKKAFIDCAGVVSRMLSITWPKSLVHQQIRNCHFRMRCLRRGSEMRLNTIGCSLPLSSSNKTIHFR